MAFDYMKWWIACRDLIDNAKYEFQYDENQFNYEKMITWIKEHAFDNTILTESTERHDHVKHSFFSDGVFNNGQ